MTNNFRIQVSGRAAPGICYRAFDVATIALVGDVGICARLA